MSQTYPLSNHLIEGFLYKYLSEWKSIDEICAAVLENFGAEVCLPSELSKNGVVKYINKTTNLLLRGCKNEIYKCDETQTKFIKTQ